MHSAALCPCSRIRVAGQQEDLIGIHGIGPAHRGKEIACNGHIILSHEQLNGGDVGIARTRVPAQRKLTHGIALLGKPCECIPTRATNPFAQRETLPRIVNRGKRMHIAPGIAQQGNLEPHLGKCRGNTQAARKHRIHRRRRLPKEHSLAALACHQGIQYVEENKPIHAARTPLPTRPRRTLDVEALPFN